MIMSEGLNSGKFSFPANHIGNQCNEENNSIEIQTDKIFGSPNKQKILTSW